MLGFIVLGAVLTVTLVFALAAYLIDKGEERLEEGEPTRLAPIIADEEQLKHGK
jgi:hypothetical protein